MLEVRRERCACRNIVRGGCDASWRTHPYPPAEPGREVMPTKSPGLMSPTDAAVTPITFHSGLSANAAFGPSRVLTVRVDPWRLAIVPRTRTVSSACAGRISAIAMKAAIAAAPVAEIDLGVSSLLPSDGVVPPCPADLRAAPIRSETLFDIHFR